MDRLFEKIGQVGEGTYGKVYKARSKSDPSRLVALKKIRMEKEKEGVLFPVTAVREIKLLKGLQHENLISIEDIVADEDGVFLVFQYMDHDLSGLLQHPHITLATPQAKYIAQAILKALQHLHSKKIVHRDIKASNVLIDSKGAVKLADFGLAKSIDKPTLSVAAGSKMMTNRVITLWYRPLELLLGSIEYGPEVDMWGFGCVLAELVIRRHPFSGSSTEVGQIETILRRFSEPLTDNLKSLPWTHIFDFNQIERKPEESLQSLLDEANLEMAAVDLILKCLQLDPRKRLSASEALRHPFFHSLPLPCAPNELPDIQGEWHEFECKAKKRLLTSRTGAHPSNTNTEHM